MDLPSVFENLMQRNDRLGLARYDKGDIEIRFPLPWLYQHAANRLARLSTKLLKVPVMLAPRWSRRLLGMRRYVSPGVYFQLGRAYLCALQWDRDRADCWRRRLAEICQAALRDSIVQDACRHWGVGRAYPVFGETRQPDAPCAHMTLRVGSMLLTAGEMLDEPRYVDAAHQAARTMCDRHRWHEKPDGRLTVSYFIDSDDEIVNITAGTAELLAGLLAAGREEDDFRRRLVGLLRTVLVEQSPEGRWAYGTRDYIEATGLTGAADGFHTAYVLVGLLRALRAGVLDEPLASEVAHAAASGLEYMCRAFFRPGGFARELDDSSVREASIMGYAECAACMCEALSCPHISEELRVRLGLAELTRGAIETAIRRFVHPRTWDVAGYRFGPLRVHFQSIRWGSGVLMKAISQYLAWQAGRGAQPSP